MVHFQKLIGLILFCGFLSGCASSVDCKVFAFHELTKPQGERVRLQHDDPAQMATDEYALVATQIREKAIQAGYQMAGDQVADLVLVIDYGVGRGADEIKKLPKCSTRYHFRDGDYDPAYRHIYECNKQEPEVQETYIHFLELRVHRTANGKQDLGDKIYEGVVHSVNHTESLARITPYLAVALFEDFPGASGEVKRVTIEEDATKK